MAIIAVTFPQGNHALNLQISIFNGYIYRYMIAHVLISTSNHMFGSGDFRDIFENFKIALVLLSNFKIFKNAHGQFIPNRPTPNM